MAVESIPLLPPRNRAEVCADLLTPQKSRPRPNDVTKLRSPRKFVATNIYLREKAKSPHLNNATKLRSRLNDAAKLRSPRKFRSHRNEVTKLRSPRKFAACDIHLRVKVTRLRDLARISTTSLKISTRISRPHLVRISTSLAK